MLFNAVAVLAVGASALMPNYSTYYQNNAILVQLIGYFEGNLSAANDVVKLPITRPEMAAQMQPYQINMNNTVKQISAISQERTSAWKQAKFHMAQRERLLALYYLNRDESVKSAYQLQLAQSTSNLTEVFELAGLDASDPSLAYTAHISYYPLKDVYLNLGALWARKRDRSIALQKLIDYLKTF